MPRERIMDTARRVFRSYGFSPIDTPALEYLEILLGKGGDETDKQLYRFQDHGGRDVGLRFDLTVPLARFAAQHIGELGTPFKRYHIATVWRGENTQRGRYREFMQCDFDTIGTTSVAADVETVLVVHDLLAAIGFERFTIHVNNRLVLTGLLESLGLEPKSADVLRALDKLPRSAPSASSRKSHKRPAHSADQRERESSSWSSSPARTTRSSTQLGRSSPAASAASEGVDRLAELLVGRRSRRRAGRARAARRLDRPRPRLLHRHRSRNHARRPAHDRQRLQRRPLR